MDYRTKSTVAEGIASYWPMTEHSFAMDYQPGNGTRYVLAFQPITIADARRGLGVPDGGWVISKLEGSSAAMVVPSGPGAFLHWTYLAQYMKVNKADAVVLAEVVGHVIGIPSTTTADARAEDERADARTPKPVDEEADSIDF